MGTHLNEAVVFVLIGWNDTYDGTTRIVGGHKYLKDNTTNNSEMRALVRDSDGYFHCGAGRGALKEKMVTAVLIARHPINLSYEAVAIYHNALPRVGKDQWATVSAQRITVFPTKSRPTFKDWPAGQGMRRWAHRNLRGPVHSRLLASHLQAHIKRGWNKNWRTGFRRLRAERVRGKSTCTFQNPQAARRKAARGKDQSGAGHR